MTAGYSGTPLPKKLGITPGAPVLVLGDPLGFDVTRIEAPVHRVSDGIYPVVLLFCADGTALIESFDTAKEAQSTTGAIWVCWPKKSSGVATDLTDDAVRRFGLANGRVDVKVAAIDPVWSGLKFVTRVADRGQTR
jgi:hypothetical protein